MSNPACSVRKLVSTLPIESECLEAEGEEQTLNYLIYKIRYGLMPQASGKEMNSVRAYRNRVLPVLRLAAAIGIPLMGMCPAFRWICCSLCPKVSPGNGG